MEKISFIAVGDSSVGKTALINALTGSDFDENIEPSNFGVTNTDIWVNCKKYGFEMSDCSGSPEYDRLRPLLYLQAKIVLLCFALDNVSSFQNISERWIGEARAFCKNGTLILVGCKEDKYRMNEISEKDIWDVLVPNEIHSFVPCSAKTYEGIDELIKSIIKLRNGFNNIEEEEENDESH